MIDRDTSEVWMVRITTDTSELQKELTRRDDARPQVQRLSHKCFRGHRHQGALSATY